MQTDFCVPWLKDIGKEKQIIGHTNNLSLSHWKKKLVQDAKMAQCSKYELLVSTVDDIQFSFITKHNEKMADR